MYTATFYALKAKVSSSRTAWMDNIKTWTGLPVEERTKINEESTSVVWLANPRIEEG